MAATARAVIVASVMLIAVHAQAQPPPPPPKAAGVLASVEQHYAKVAHLRITFRHVLTPAGAPGAKTQDGTLFVTRTGYTGGSTGSAVRGASASRGR